MKTKFQSLGSLVIALVFVSAKAFAGDPTGTGSTTASSNTSSILAVNNTNSTESTLSYHHGGGSSGDGAFSGNLLHIGVGFVSGEGNLYTGSGYTSSVSPAFEISYERALSSKFGVGVNFSYQSAKSTYSGTGTTYNYTTGTFDTYNYTDTYKLSLIQFCGRFAYHFSAGDKFDPYIGAELGYCTVSDSYTTTDPNASGSSSSSLTGVEFGAYGGARYFFSDHIGAWVELQYAVASFKVDTGVSGVSASVSINPCTVFNLGLAFKF